MQATSTTVKATTTGAGKTERQRRDMVTTAVRWLPQRGMAAVNLIEVARAVGAPRGSIYHYFPGGRDQLLQEALEVAHKSGLRMVEKAAKHSASVEAFIQSVFSTSLQQIGLDSFTGGCPVGAAVLSYETENTSFQAQTQLAFAEWQQLMAASLMQLGIKNQSQAIELAQGILMAYEGALVCAKGARDPQMFDSAARMVLALAGSMIGK